VPVLQLALVQLASTLDTEQNRNMLDIVDTIASDAQTLVDLVVLPEAFARDFGEPGSNLAESAETLDGPFVHRLRDAARRNRTTIVAGMFEQSEDPSRPYNTVVVVDGNGLRATYRKIHLYDSFGYKESDRLLAGPVTPEVLDVGGFKVALMTCYDLRFPELARELVGRGAELLVVPSAWVAGPGKVDHWRTMVKARAIENTVYVAAVGQPGPRYSGHSMVVSASGEVLTEAGEHEAVVTAEIAHQALTAARTMNPSLANRRF